MNPFVWLRRRRIANQIAAVRRGFGAAPIHKKAEFGLYWVAALIVGGLMLGQAWRNRAAMLAHIELISVAALALAGPLLALSVLSGLKTDREAAMTGWLSAAPLGQAEKRGLWRESAVRAGLVQAAPLWIALIGLQLLAARPGLVVASLAVVLGAVGAGVLAGEAPGPSARARPGGKGGGCRAARSGSSSGLFSGVARLVWTAPRTRAVAAFLAALTTLAIAALILSDGVRPDGLGLLVLLIGAHLVFIGLFRTPELVFSPLLQLSGSRFAAVVAAVGVVAAAASLAAFTALATVTLAQGDTQVVIWAIAAAILLVLNLSWAVVAVAFPYKPMLRQLAYLLIWTGLGVLMTASIPLGALASLVLFGALWRRARQRFRGGRL